MALLLGTAKRRRSLRLPMALVIVGRMRLGRLECAAGRMEDGMVVEGEEGGGD